MLQKRYYELSRELHPDRFMRKPEAERQKALDLSSTLNDAYRTLKDPLKRAHYVLEPGGLRCRRAAVERRSAGIARRSL